MIKIVHTGVIYNLSMVQKHPVYRIYMYVLVYRKTYEALPILRSMRELSYCIGVI